MRRSKRYGADRLLRQAGVHIHQPHVFGYQANLVRSAAHDLGDPLIGAKSTSSFPDDLNMVDLGYVTQGLQTLIREGRYIHGGVRACGAAGRVLTLESVK
jgi:hypothetical protein